MKSILRISLICLCCCAAILYVSKQKNSSPEIADQYLSNPELRFDGPAKYAAIHSMIRTRDGEAVPAYKTGDQLREYEKAKAASHHRTGSLYDWIERGPGNVGGRTRGLIVDPSDTTHLTWYAGSVGGGVWRTSNAGGDWELLTKDIPNLATSTLAMSESNTDVIYAGTGEGFGNSDGINGSGIWKSTDRGATWNAIPGTTNNQVFANVTRLIINPNNENEVLASTIGEFSMGMRLSYIMKTIDGGLTWTEAYSTGDGRIQQLVYDPNNFNVIYATVNSVGVVKSEDTGANWSTVFDVDGLNIQRIEMAISRLDAGVIYMSCETNRSSALYFTRDTFRTVQTPVFNGRQPDWLATQGWYDNTIAVHPYNDSMAWMAGAGSMLQLKPGNELDTIKRYDQFINQTTYLTEIETSPFGESYGLAADLFQGLPVVPETDISDLVDVLIYFGPGRSQKAHLFSVDIFTYSFDYQEMVDVPFEAWDTLNNRQIAINVYDVDGNGEWTYADYTGQAQPFHDVVTANTIDYVDTGNVILQTTNPVYKAQYYFFLQQDTSYHGDETNFPEGHIAYLTREEEGLISEFTPITDGYFEYTDIEFVGSKGVHVDHHNIIFIPLDDTSQSFYLLNANDGGVAFSTDNAENFIQTGSTFDDGSGDVSYGYNVSQFYGVDKMNGGNRYIGGTQDNGTWISPHNPDETTNWVGAPSGDGFECAWHYTDTNLILETSQFNSIWKSYDSGETWSRVFLPGGGGPFITRVAASQLDPDLVFMVAMDGVLKSTDFGDNWEVISMPDEWRFNGSWGPPIEVSVASPNVVWTGGSMRDNNGITVSTDKGSTFNTTMNYGDAFLGTITGIATHPLDSNTAYALFSQANGPKILKTEDLGNTWNDLSGFITNVEESTNGYPDVATYCLLVMPWDADWMWAGTEIGIFESRDGGLTWAMADNGLPPVSIWEMKIVSDEIVLATHGRGIWSLNIDELNPVGTSNTNPGVISSLNVYPNPMELNADIFFKLDEKQHISVSLYTINGRSIKLIHDGILSAGSHQFSFERNELISGTYLVVVDAKQGKRTQQIILK